MGAAAIVTSFLGCGIYCATITYSDEEEPYWQNNMDPYPDSYPDIPEMFDINYQSYHGGHQITPSPSRSRNKPSIFGSIKRSASTVSVGKNPALQIFQQRRCPCGSEKLVDIKRGVGRRSDGAAIEIRGKICERCGRFSPDSDCIKDAGGIHLDSSE